MGAVIPLLLVPASAGMLAYVLSRRFRMAGVARLDLVPGRRIVQAWRRQRFPERIFSMAAVTLTPTADGGTQFVLTHRGVPKELIPDVEQAWREHWGRMRAFIAAGS